MSPLDPAQTLIRFFRALDDRDEATLVRLLAPGGVWHRQGAELRSEADIAAAMAERSPTMRIHHLLTNVFAEAHGADEAVVTAYMLVVRHDFENAADRAFPALRRSRTSAPCAPGCAEPRTAGASFGSAAIRRRSNERPSAEPPCGRGARWHAPAPASR